jgi:lipoprotein NlpD
LLAAALLAALLSACGSSPERGVGVEERGQGAPRATLAADQYRVQSGDTLYSIAFRFGQDWKTLAANNRIGPPYLIKPGQVLQLQGSSRPAAPAHAATAPVQAPRPAVAPSPPVQAAAPAPLPVPVETAPPNNPETRVMPVKRSASGWAWPAEGALIGRFSSNGSLNKGIDIAGDLGQPVLAASDGSVVYAGSGLRGYGELLIIKHSDTYVSAYGHNRRLLVREGQKVKAGQVIAEMGSTGTDRVKLHFEIRQHGKPVDPLRYLPAR